MTFIRDLGRRRIEALHAQAGGDVRAGGAANELRMPELQPGTPPAAKKKAAGLSGAMMRASVSDLYKAGERLGLNLPILSRHFASIAPLKTALEGYSAALERPALLRRPADQAVFQALPRRIFGALTPGLLALDPNNSAQVILAVMEKLSAMLGDAAPNTAQVQAMERLGRGAAELKSTDMARDLVACIDRIMKEADPSALTAASEAALNGVAQFAQVPGLASELLRYSLLANLEAIGGGNAKAAIAAAANAEQKNLSAGQIGMLVDIAKNATAAAEAHRAAEAAVVAALPEKEQAFEGQIAAFLQAGNLDEAQARQLRELADRAERELSPSARLSWLEVSIEAAGHGPSTFRASAIGLLNLHVGAQGLHPDLARQVVAQIAQLPQRGVEPDQLANLASDHLAQVSPTDAPATLNLINNTLAALSEAARGRLLGMVGVELDGSDGLTTLANGFAGLTERYARQEGPLAAVQACLEAAQNEASLGQALKNAARFGAAIPDFESGPIVQTLRNHLPTDLAAATAAGLDLAVVAAAHPTLPADSLARFIGIAAKHGVDPDQWLTTLETLFKNTGGKRDHVRNFRTLIAVVDEGGANPVQLVQALLKAELPKQMLTRTVTSILAESNQAPNAQYTAGLLQALEQGRNLQQEIDGRLWNTLVKGFGLQGVMGDGAGRASPIGIKELENSAQKFAQAANTIDKKIFKQFLQAMLANRVAEAKLETPAAETQLACLSRQQRAAWGEALRMTHIRFQGEGLQTFQERVASAAARGALLLDRLEGAWGKLADLEAKHANLLEQLREHKKSAREVRAPLIQQNRDLPEKIEILRWTKHVAELAPEKITPERFEKLGMEINSIEPKLGPNAAEAMKALRVLLRVNDLQYSEVISYDNAPASLLLELSTTNCLSWPARANSVMAYLFDPNKKVIVTESAKGEKRRAVLRLVERQDEGHVGEPMLLLERSYPNEASVEERQRLLEHTLRRGAAMGIAVCFATEYYWDASKTSRGLKTDMNKVLEDLCLKYGTDVEKKVITVLNRKSNMSEEYLDSDSPANIRGVASDRTHRGQADKAFENEFVILSPKA